MYQIKLSEDFYYAGFVTALRDVVLATRFSFASPVFDKKNEDVLKEVKKHYKGAHWVEHDTTREGE